MSAQRTGKRLAKAQTAHLVERHPEADVLEPALKEPTKRAFLPLMGATQIIVMCAADALGNDAYGVKIAELVETWLGKRINVGQIYGTADGLHEIGLLDTQLRPSPHGKGRPVTIYKLSKKGRAALRAVRLVNQASRKEHDPDGSQQRETPRSRLPGNTPEKVEVS